MRGPRGATDAVVWQHAVNEQAAIGSKDEDFVDRWLLSDNPVAVICIRNGNCSNRALMAWFEPLWLEALKRLGQSDQFIELRG